MDTSVIFALCLGVAFFGAIVWLIIHARRQERATRSDIEPDNTGRTPEPHK